MIVLGLGYGDEGKGLSTSFLCSQTHNPLVIRFNGGHQAGHTVVHQGMKHVFSSFGSGTLQGVPTYWSRFCTVSPSALVKEHAVLNELGVKPKLFIDPEAPVTTPFDIMANRGNNQNKIHGSVGVGFGKTIFRNERSGFKLYAKDIMFETVCFQKVFRIGTAYYGFPKDVAEKIAEEFVQDCKKASLIFNIEDMTILGNYSGHIYEGAQGILLDMDHGFFPNVTYSNTTGKNAYQLGAEPEVYYVTRAYATRHGNGFLHNEGILALRNNEGETNVENEYQGKFRTAPLSIEMLRYAIASDTASYGGSHVRRNLIVTCADQYDIDVHQLVEDIGCEFENVYVSFGPSYENIAHIDDCETEEVDEEIEEVEAT